MKQRLSLCILLVLICMLAMPAMAAPAPTGATPEEIALYNMEGAAEQGMPAFAKEKLGTERGAAFVTVKEASSPTLQHGYATVMAAAQALSEETGMSLEDAISIMLRFSAISYNENKNGLKMYDYGFEGYLTLATEENALFYMYFTDGYRDSLGSISKGSGYYSQSFGIGADEDWYQDISIYVTLEREDGTVLAQSGIIVLPKPEE